MNDDDRDSQIELAQEVVKRRRGQTARWVVIGAVLLAALVLAGGWLLVHLSLQTRDELRCLVRRQAQVEANQRAFVIRQHRRLIALALEIARREGVPTKGLQDLRTPPPTTSERERDSDGGSDPPGGKDPRDPPNPPPPRPRPTPDDPCLVKIGDRCILPSPTPLVLAAAVEMKDAPRGCDARQ